jgi:predicted phage-related endonuclease
MPQTPQVSNSTRNSDRRLFLGGSDARIIMSSDEAALLRLWQEKRGEVEPETSRTTSSSNSASPPNRSIGAGTNAIPGKPSKRSNAGFATR